MTRLRSMTGLVIGMLIAGCATMTSSGPRATANLAPTAGNRTAGTVTFTPNGDRVRVLAKVTGLASGAHGFHIHEKGDCSAPNFSSAGGHFNPLGAPHGSPTDPKHHVGDFGNIEANDQGTARFERVFYWLTLSGTNSILNRAVVVHEAPKTAGMGAEIAALIQEHCFLHLEAPVQRSVAILRPYRGEVARRGPLDIFMAARRYQMVFFMVASGGVFRTAVFG